MVNESYLAEIGIEEWYVPHPDNVDSRIAHAVIAGDHSINYNHPEGFAKIALIRGPDTESIFEDPTVLDSSIRQSSVSATRSRFCCRKCNQWQLPVYAVRKLLSAE